jgi:TetR/AcrR family transcriptional regulator, transcriptional repressor for nem operon
VILNARCRLLTIRSRIECSSYGPFGPDQRSFKTDVNFSNTLLARGYAATTVDAICEKAELTKGSFYYFFDSKEDLGLAVLDWSLRRSAQMLASGTHARIVDPVEKAFAFLEHLEKCSPELWSGGCLLGSFSMELADTNSRAQQVVAGMFQALEDDFAEKLQPIADQCAGKQAPQASGFADTLLSIVEGSIILAKAHRDPTRIPKAIRGFRLSLATLIADPRVGRTRLGKPIVKRSKSLKAHEQGSYRSKAEYRNNYERILIIEDELEMLRI